MNYFKTVIYFFKHTFLDNVEKKTHMFFFLKITFFSSSITDLIKVELVQSFIMTEYATKKLIYFTPNI